MICKATLQMPTTHQQAGRAPVLNKLTANILAYTGYNITTNSWKKRATQAPEEMKRQPQHQMQRPKQASVTIAAGRTQVTTYGQRASKGSGPKGMCQGQATPHPSTTGQNCAKCSNGQGKSSCNLSDGPHRTKTTLKRHKEKCSTPQYTANTSLSTTLVPGPKQQISPVREWDDSSSGQSDQQPLTAESTTCSQTQEKHP